MKNVHGWGPYSPSITIKAADIPETPSAVVTSITDIYVKFEWSQPDDRSSPITEYELSIRQSDQTTFTEETTYCEGARSAIISSRYCLVPMTALRAGPYSLGYSNLVVAKLRARNDIGWSPLSSENGAGALV